MPKASVTRLIERDKVKLINFVLDIEKYPEFIPFCIDSKVYEKKEDDDVVNIIADLTIGKKPFVDTYKSDVKYIKNQDLIHVTNIDGPIYVCNMNKILVLNVLNIAFVCIYKRFFSNCQISNNIHNIVIFFLFVYF